QTPGPTGGSIAFAAPGPIRLFLCHRYQPMQLAGVRARGAAGFVFGGAHFLHGIAEKEPRDAGREEQGEDDGLRQSREPGLVQVFAFFFAGFDLLRATAWRMSALNAVAA